MRMSEVVVICCFVLGIVVCVFPEPSAGALEDLQCQPWSFLDNSSNCECYENSDRRLSGAVYCTDHGTLLQFGYILHDLRRGQWDLPGTVSIF